MTKLNIFLPVILPLRPPNSGSSRMSHKKATVIGKNATGIRTEFSLIRTIFRVIRPADTNETKKERPTGPPFYALPKVTMKTPSPKRHIHTPTAQKSAFGPFVPAGRATTPCHAVFFCYFCIFIASCHGP